MKLTKLAQAGVCLLFSLLFSGMASATSTPGSQTISLSTTPTQLACSGQRYVQSLTIRVVPGGTGKVYIGTSSMNTSTLAGTIAVLYPNGGAHSEEYTITDMAWFDSYEPQFSTAENGIDLCDLYVAGGVSGEFALAEYYSIGSGTTAPSYFLRPFFQAVKANDWALTTSSNSVTFSDFRVQVLPGGSGKITLDYNLIDVNNDNTFTSGNDIILYPNSGTLSQHNAWSEAYRVTDPLGSNGYTFYKDTASGNRTDFYITPAVAGETALVSAWQKQNSSGTPISGGYFGIAYQLYVYNATMEPASVQLGDLEGFGFHVRTVPGYSSKVYIGDSNVTTSSHLSHVLYPNNTGSLGWSETFSPNGDCRSDYSELYGMTDPSLSAGISFDWSVELTGVTACSTSQPNTESSAVLSATTTPVALASGNVSYLHVSVIPGQTGKIYIGSSTMNTTNLSGVYAILYPNNVGRWSETFELLDREGDGIPASAMYFLPQVSGEGVIVSSTVSNQTPYHGVFSVAASGAVGDSSSTAAATFVSSSTPFEVARIQVIPGGTGKVAVGTSSMSATQPDGSLANTLKVLWPNTGSYDVGEGHSERFELQCPVSTTSCYDLQNYKFFPYVSGEKLLMFAISR